MQKGPQWTLFFIWYERRLVGHYLQLNKKLLEYLWMTSILYLLHSGSFSFLRYNLPVYLNSGPEVVACHKVSLVILLVIPTSLTALTPACSLS